MTTAVAEKPDPQERVEHAPGIYFGLDETSYRNTHALGSTDKKKLAESPPDFWFESVYNEMRKPEKDTPSRKLGRAIHKFALEGREAFEEIYAPKDLNWTTVEGKAEKARIHASGKTPLDREDWDKIMMLGTYIRANPAIAASFSGGMPEVSVFWERDGIQNKARFDYLKPRAVVDLKSEANPFGLHFPVACRKTIDRYRYTIQAAHYMEARALLPAFIADGAVYGDCDPAWLKKVASAPDWAWVWIFYQSERSPLTWGRQVSPNNSIFDDARADIARAEVNYKQFVSVFGLDEPWVLSEDLEELDPCEIRWPYQGMGR
jgi:hypothetical protein